MRGNPGGTGHRARLAAALVAGMLVLAACGDSDDGDAAGADGTDAAAVDGASGDGSGASTTVTTAAPATTLPPLALTEEDTITTRAFGEVLVGAEVEEAALAAGTEFIAQGDPVGEGDCQWFRTAAGPAGADYLVRFGRIARIDISSGPVTTRSGAGIGMTEEEIVELFGNKIVTQTNPNDPGGKLLIFVPVDDADKNRRVIWETDGEAKVTSFRTGQLPEVLYANGCQDAVADTGTDDTTTTTAA